MAVQRAGVELASANCPCRRCVPDEDLSKGEEGQNTLCEPALLVLQLASRKKVRPLRT